MLGGSVKVQTENILYQSIKLIVPKLTKLINSLSGSYTHFSMPRGARMSLDFNESK